MILFTSDPSLQICSSLHDFVPPTNNWKNSFFLSAQTSLKSVAQCHSFQSVIAVADVDPLRAFLDPCGITVVDAGRVRGLDKVETTVAGVQVLVDNVGKIVGVAAADLGIVRTRTIADSLHLSSRIRCSHIT